MLVVSTSLAAAASTQLSTHFSGLRKSVLKLDNSKSTSSDSLLQNVDSHIRLASCRGFVMMSAFCKFFVGGNWKSILTFWRLPFIDDVVAPPFVYIDQVKKALSDQVVIAPQNCWTGKSGEFMGEICAEQINDLGCTGVVLEHSEWRNVIGEDNEFIGNKAAYVLSQNLGVMACIGELLEERKAGKTFDVCYQQLKAFADGVPDWDNIWI